MCIVIVSEAVFNKKGKVKAIDTRRLGIATHVTYVCEDRDIERDISYYPSIIFGEGTLFEQTRECHDYCLSDCGRRLDPVAMGLDKVYLTLADDSTVLVRFSGTDNGANKPRYIWEVFTE